MPDEPICEVANCPHHTQEPPHKETASASSIPEPDIDEIFDRVFRYGLEVGKLNKDYQTLNESVDAKAEKQALYQRLASEAVHLSETDRMMMSVKTIEAIPLSKLAELFGVKE